MIDNPNSEYAGSDFREEFPISLSLSRPPLCVSTLLCCIFSSVSSFFRPSKSHRHHHHHHHYGHEFSTLRPSLSRPSPLLQTLAPPGDAPSPPPSRLPPSFQSFLLLPSPLAWFYPIGHCAPPFAPLPRPICCTELESVWNYHAPLAERGTMGSTEEPERKRRHLSTSMSPTHKKQPVLQSSDDKKVDPGMLQYQNQKLTQQLDVQRDEIAALQSKYNRLKNKQSSYDSTLTSVHNAWGQLTSKLELLAERANTSSNCMVADTAKDSISLPALPEEAFLHRLLDRGATDCSTRCNDNVLVPLASKSRQSATLKSVEYLVRAIDSQHARREELFQNIRQKTPSQNSGQQILKLRDELMEEIISLRSSLDTLHLKHNDLASQARFWRTMNARDQAEIKCVSGELHETITDLEAIQQKISTLKNQKNSPTATRSGVRDRSGEKPCRDAKMLEMAIEEAKIVASRRSSELEEALQEKKASSQRLQQIQEQLAADKHITSSHVLTSLTSQVQFLKKEVERYKSLVDISQAEKDDAVNRVKDATEKAELSEAVHKTNLISSATVVELEAKVHASLLERNNLFVRLEETSHALERQDEVAEFKVMVSTLEKEMSMMQQQLDKYKEAVCGAESLRTEVESTGILLDRKTSEHRFLLEKIADQDQEMALLQDEVKLLRESEQELKLIIDMYGSESLDARDTRELKDAECRVWAEVEKLKASLEDHSLELRVKVANEAEAACQQRLAAAESEITEIRQRLDASERVVMELNEAAKMKNEEHDAYLAEIETIGQAYEDMQTQNQRLLQQISERDDYNIKLVSESVKAKQLQASMLDEKQALVNRIQHASSLADAHRQRVEKLEEQVGTYLEQVGKAMEDARKHVSVLESLKRRSVQGEKECSVIKSSVEAVQKELEMRKVKTADIQAQLDKEKLAKKKAQEELSSLRSKAAHLDVQNEGSPLVDKLQEEIKEYKAILKCSVCHDRPKEVVITKCYHLFCSPCIQRNLEIRHRKCPGCGINFGQNDVRNVYI